MHQEQCSRTYVPKNGDVDEASLWNCDPHVTLVVRHSGPRGDLEPDKALRAGDVDGAVRAHADVVHSGPSAQPRVVIAAVTQRDVTTEGVVADVIFRSRTPGVVVVLRGLLGHFHRGCDTVCHVNGRVVERGAVAQIDGVCI